MGRIKKEKKTYYDKVHDNGGKHWNYQCVIYEDSAPKDWISIISHCLKIIFEAA